MVIPFLATAAWLGLGALGVLGAKEKETARLRNNATLREQRSSAEQKVERSFSAAQTAFSRYLRNNSTIFRDIEQERWDALANINTQYLANRQNATILYDFALPIVKGTTLALDLFGNTILRNRVKK